MKEKKITEEKVEMIQEKKKTMKDANLEKLKTDVKEIANDLTPITEEVMEETKDAIKEASKEVKKHVRKRKKKLREEAVYLQVNGMQYDVGEYVRKIKETHPDISELHIYIKPEDHKVYYVADDVHDYMEM